MPYRPDTIAVHAGQAQDAHGPPGGCRGFEPVAEGVQLGDEGGGQDAARVDAQLQDVEGWVAGAGIRTGRGGRGASGQCRMPLRV